MKNTRKLLAWLLALCLLLGCLSAMADAPEEVEGKLDADGNYTIDVGVVEGTGGNGINLDSDAQLAVDGKTVTGPLLGSAQSVTINADSVSDTRYGINEVACYFEGDITINVTGDVKTEREGTGSQNTDGIYIDTDKGAVKITTGDVSASVSASGEESRGSAYGIETNHDKNGPIDLNVGSVTAEATGGSAEAVGLDMSARKNEEAGAAGTTDLTADGAVSATAIAEGEHGAAEATGIESSANSGGSNTIAVSGDVSATAEGDISVATGVSVMAEDGSSVDIDVTGDVTAQGKASCGVYMEGTAGDSKVDVLVDGTVTAETQAVSVSGVYDAENEKYVVGDVLLTTWAALSGSKTDSVGEILDRGSGVAISDEGEVTPIDKMDPGVIDEDQRPQADGDLGSQPVGEEPAEISDAQKDAAAEALREAVQYIIRFNDDEVELDEATRTYTTGEGEKYNVAREGEVVRFAALIDEATTVVSGIFYRTGEASMEDQEVLADEEDNTWGRNEDGTFWVTMLRGGAMHLGLKTHKHDDSNDEMSVRQETVKEPTCTEAGSHKVITHCGLCGKDIKTETVTDPATGHTAGKAVRENEKAATCTEAGSYEEAVYCTACNAELSRETKVIPAKGHVAGKAVEENRVEAKPGVAGSYDLVVRCTVCNAELSRETVAIPALPEEETGGKTTGDRKQPALVYEEVPELHGVRSAGRPGMSDALDKVGDAYKGETVTIEIIDQEKLIPAEQLSAFQALPLKDRLAIAMQLLGCGQAEGLTEAGAAVLADVEAAIADMTEEELALRDAGLEGCFLPRQVTVDGEDHDSVGIELKITNGATETRERWTFFDDAGAWRLLKIEKGSYK